MSPPASSSLSPFPAKAVLLFALLYVGAWTLLPAVLTSSVPLDVAESLSWGKEWQWGYYKHPPLAPSVLHLFYEVFGLAGPYLLSQLCITLTLWMVWRTGCRLMDRHRALLGTALTMGVAYYTFPAIEYNHNIAQMPLWAAIAYCFCAALQDGKLRQWVMLGLLAGLGLLTKYTIGVLLLALFLYLLASPVHRKLLLKPGPWITLVILLLVFAPHALWLWHNQGLPFTYAGERALAQSGSPRLQALGFPLTQFLVHLPMLLVTAWALWRSRRPATAQPARATPWHLHTRSPALLLSLALLPGMLVTVVGISLGVHLRDMWGSPMWAFSGLLLMACVPDRRVAPLAAPLLRGLGVWLVLATALLVIYASWGAQLRERASRVDWPAVSMAKHAQQSWQAVAHCPLDTVAGDYWLVGLLSAYVADRPSVLIDGDPRFSPWVDAQRIAQHGALWVWRAQPGHTTPPAMPAPLAQASAHSDLQQHEGVWNIAWPHDPNGPPLTLHWRSFVPAACHQG